MADTAFLKGNPLKRNKPSPRIQKSWGLWPFSHVVMLLGVLCLAVAYEEIVASELVPLLLPNSSESLSCLQGGRILSACLKLKNTPLCV